MPVFKTEQIGFDGGIITLKWKVNNKGMFSLDLPTRLHTELNIKPVIEGTNFDNLHSLFNSLLKEFATIQTTERQVIAYHVEMNITVWDENQPNAGPVLQRNDISFANGLALSLSVGVFNEITIHKSGGDSVRYEYDHSISFELPHSIRSGRLEHYDVHNGAVKFIDYTPERLQFFINLGLALEDLCLKINNFLGTPDTLIEAVDRGIKMLPGGTE